MLMRTMLRARATTLLLASSIFGTRVYPGRTTEVMPAEMPTISLHIVSDTGTTASNDGNPQFSMTASLLLRITHSAPLDADLDDQLDDLCDQTISLLLTTPYFCAPSPGYPIRAFRALSTTIEMISTDTPTKCASIAIDCEYTDEYEPIFGPLRTITTTIDAVSPFDPNGQYSPKYPAPRTSGPDGRIELDGGTITLPQ